MNNQPEAFDCAGGCGKVMILEPMSFPPDGWVTGSDRRAMCPDCWAVPPKSSSSSSEQRNSVGLCFLDTETTGLDARDEIWEVAAVRVRGGEAERLHLFLEHDVSRCKLLPEPFQGDHQERMPAACTGRVVSKASAARQIATFTEGFSIVGAVPSFDTERLARLLGAHHITPKWHYQLIDAETMAVGRLAAMGIEVPLPWDSSALSRAIGIDPDLYARHTAMGDVEWARAMFNACLAPLPEYAPAPDALVVSEE